MANAKILYTALLAVGLLTTTSCEDYLDVNTNPNGPDMVVDPHLYLPPMLSELALAIQFDGRYLGKYIGNWHGTATETVWDRHGYAGASDVAGQIWRSTYYTMGINLRDMIMKAEEQKKWDFVAVGYALQAFNWQLTTDYHGEIIYTQAFDPTLSAFNYDSQELVYGEVKRLGELALTYFEKAKAEPHPNSRLAEGDLLYGGDAGKWEKFTYGVLAINAHHLTNKANYNPDQVIDYVNKAFVNNADDASVRFQGSVSADANFWGPLRGNLISPSVRQSKFITGLLDGTNAVLTDASLVNKDPVATFATQHLKDPRLPTMLAVAPDGQYRGIAFIGSTEYANVNQRPNNLYGNVSDVAGVNTTGKYLFQNAGRFPIMTYAQLQFIKAEAAYKKGTKDVALTAYKAGVNAHMDFVRALTPTTDQATFDARRTLYMASVKLVPAAPADLTLSHILLQKYISQWAWGFVETWSDLRRYHYIGGEDGGTYEEVDTDPTNNVFRGYMLPPSYNNTVGKPAYRVRPRYNSEYIWNVESLRSIGALDANYQTVETWFSKK